MALSLALPLPLKPAQNVMYVCMVLIFAMALAKWLVQPP
jgi:hypothetical protein